ncbi:hypothetical protein EAG_15362 [Camponotus floridanus]|uniref:Uncharacterized protein n=1 Tax=Camponotus floridanus TaxID=104421 RepID=E2AC56_CAMFO|nr:hypothetical protein EAG_15362 [Camponotus floridanus]
MIMKFMKLIIDTIIHGYALHSIYGWSLHLLGAFWNSVANLLLHKGTRRYNTRSNDRTRQSPFALPTTEEDDPRPLTRNQGLHPCSTSEATRNYKELRKLLEEDMKTISSEKHPNTVL